MVDRDTVEACYRAILDRPPESEAVVAEKMGAASLEALICDMVACPEFGRPRPAAALDGAHHYAPPAPIDADVSEDQRAALFERLRRHWRALGEAEPFWSVLTHDAYRSASLDAATLERFYETGAEHAGLLERFAARTGTPLPRGACLELGCGVGRVTKHLAGLFERVIAVDISEGNLRECRAMAARAGLSNIDFVLLGAPDEIAGVGPFDVFFTIITLQHSQPPVQKYMLGEILGKLAPGGVFLFQAQTYWPDYAFSAQAYLAAADDAPGAMEMHSLPMHEILRLIDRRGCLALEVLEDGWTGRAGSHTFFGVKRGG